MEIANDINIMKNSIRSIEDNITMIRGDVCGYRCAQNDIQKLSCAIKTIKLVDTRDYEVLKSSLESRIADLEERERELAKREQKFQTRLDKYKTLVEDIFEEHSSYHYSDSECHPDLTGI